MEYEIEALVGDDYCSITAQGDYFVQFCNPPLPTLVADNATLGMSSSKASSSSLQSQSAEVLLHSTVTSSFAWRVLEIKHSFTFDY